MITNYTPSPIYSGTEFAGVCHEFTLGDASGSYATLRFEALPQILFFHPVLKRFDRGILSSARDTAYELAKQLIEEYGYQRIHFYTANTKLVKLFARTEPTYIGEAEGMSIYSIEV